MVSVKVVYVRRLKSGRLEYRRAFPKALRAHVGRNELIVSLGARSLSDHGAMERYRAANDEYDRLEALARKAVSESFDALDAPRIAWLAESYAANLLAEDERQRTLGSVDREAHEAAEMGFQSILEDYSGPRIQEMFEDDALRLAASQGWHLDTRTEPFAALCYSLLKAHIRAIGVQLERDAGCVVDTPYPQPLPTSGRLASPPKGGSFASIVREEMKRPTFIGGASTKQSWNTALRYLGEVLGDLSPDEITRSKVGELSDALALAPVKRATKPEERGWAIPRLVEAYSGRDVERLSWKTRSSLLGALQAAWTRCQRSGSIREALPNPFALPNLGKAPRPQKNDGLTRDEATAIFALPVFTAGERPAGGRGDASYWLPILLMATGARPEELAQSLVADVRHEPDGDHWSLAITTEGTHPHKRQRNLKTPSAERVIPFPSVVLELGFADYVKWLTRAGEEALFPLLRPKGERGELFASFGAWWSSYLAQHEARPSGKRPAREFRPTWATIARECGVSREAQEYLMGHAPDTSDMNARYGSREPLSREMGKLTFHGWGLEQARPWEPSSK